MSIEPTCERRRRTGKLWGAALGCVLVTAACVVPTISMDPLDPANHGWYALRSVGGARLPYVEITDSTRLEIRSGSLTISGERSGAGSACTFTLAFRESSRGVDGGEHQETVGCVALVTLRRVLHFEIDSGAVQTRRFGMDCRDPGQCASATLAGRTITIKDRRGIEFEFRK